MGMRAMVGGVGSGFSRGLAPAAGLRTSTGATGDGAVPLDTAIARLQDRGGFMSQLLSRLRTQQASMTAPAATVGGAPRATLDVARSRGGFFGGVGY